MERSFYLGFNEYELSYIYVGQVLSSAIDYGAKKFVGDIGRVYGYRYAFNGKEQDPEWNGVGNMYDYGFRIYDPRLAKFLSVEPLASSFSWYTPYQYAGNKPIVNMDLDGLEDYNYLEELFSKGVSYLQKAAVEYTKSLMLETAAYLTDFASEKADEVIDEVANGKVVVGGFGSASAGGVIVKVSIDISFSLEGDVAGTFKFDSDAVVENGKLKFVTRKTDLKAGGGVTYVYDNTLETQLKQSGILQDVIDGKYYETTVDMVVANMKSQLEGDISAYGADAKVTLDPKDLQLSGSAGYAVSPEVTIAAGTKSIGVGFQKTIGARTVRQAGSVVSTDLDPTPKIVTTVDLLSFEATIASQDSQGTSSNTQTSTSSGSQQTTTTTTTTTTEKK